MKKLLNSPIAIVSEVFTDCRHSINNAVVIKLVNIAMALSVLIKPHFSQSCLSKLLLS